MSVPPDKHEVPSSIPPESSKRVGRIWLVLGFSLTIASIGILVVFQLGYGVALVRELLGTSVHEFLESGSHSFLLSIALLLMALECLCIGRFLSNLDGKMLVERYEYSDSQDEDDAPLK